MRLQAIGKSLWRWIGRRYVLNALNIICKPQSNRWRKCLQRPLTNVYGTISQNHNGRILKHGRKWLRYLHEYIVLWKQKKTYVVYIVNVPNHKYTCNLAIHFKCTFYFICTIFFCFVVMQLYKLLTYISLVINVLSWACLEGYRFEKKKKSFDFYFCTCNE